jgi:hypothetical protein
MRGYWEMAEASSTGESGYGIEQGDHFSLISAWSVTSMADCSTKSKERFTMRINGSAETIFRSDSDPGEVSLSIVTINWNDLQF